jgi:GNAT superfamily N-acetyltransferase
VQIRPSLSFSHRFARNDDRPALESLVDASIRALLMPHLSEAQVEASREIMGLDTQLIDDGTYFLAECGGRIAGCGGWSRRATTFGCGHTSNRDDRLLDQGKEAARIRAMYTHPDFARRGVGRMILSLCEAAAAQAGFRRVELVATLAGERLYSACGYEILERLAETTATGVRIPVMRMAKRIDRERTNSVGP